MAWSDPSDAEAATLQQWYSPLPNAGIVRIGFTGASGPAPS